jgi:hypothetical protein
VEKPLSIQIQYEFLEVCLKRKVRNYVGLTKGEKPPYEIYVKEKAILNKQHERAYEAIGVGDILREDKKRKGGDRVDEDLRRGDVSWGRRYRLSRG